MKPPSSSFSSRLARALGIVADGRDRVGSGGLLALAPVLARRTFLLEPAPPPMASVQKLVSLRVGLVNVAAPYRGKAFVYRQDELKFEADYLQ